jgi:hypothetical protein
VKFKAWFLDGVILSIREMDAHAEQAHRGALEAHSSLRGQQQNTSAVCRQSCPTSGRLEHIQNFTWNQGSHIVLSAFAGGLLDFQSFVTSL